MTQLATEKDLDALFATDADLDALFVRRDQFTEFPPPPEMRHPDILGDLGKEPAQPRGTWIPPWQESIGPSLQEMDAQLAYVPGFELPSIGPAGPGQMPVEGFAANVIEGWKASTLGGAFQAGKAAGAGTDEQWFHTWIKGEFGSVSPPIGKGGGLGRFIGGFAGDWNPATAAFTLMRLPLAATKRKLEQTGSAGSAIASGVFEGAFLITLGRIAGGRGALVGEKLTQKLSLPLIRRNFLKRAKEAGVLPALEKALAAGDKQAVDILLRDLVRVSLVGVVEAEAAGLTVRAIEAYTTALLAGDDTGEAMQQFVRDFPEIAMDVFKTGAMISLFGGVHGILNVPVQVDRSINEFQFRLMKAQRIQSPAERARATDTVMRDFGDYLNGLRAEHAVETKALPIGAKEQIKPEPIPVENIAKPKPAEPTPEVEPGVPVAPVKPPGGAGGKGPEPVAAKPPAVPAPAEPVLSAKEQAAEDAAELTNIAAMEKLDAAVAEALANEPDSNLTSPTNEVYRALGIPLPGDPLVRIGLIRSRGPRSVDLTSPAIRSRVAEVLLRAELENKEQDADGVLGPSSALTEAGKRELLENAAGRADAILEKVSTAIANAAMIHAPAVPAPAETIRIAPLDDVKQLERLRNGTIEFNKARISKKRKQELIDEATDLRRALHRKGYKPQYLADIESARVGIPLPPTAPAPSEPTVVQKTMERPAGEPIPKPTARVTEKEILPKSYKEGKGLTRLLVPGQKAKKPTLEIAEKLGANLDKLRAQGKEKPNRVARPVKQDTEEVYRDIDNNNKRPDEVAKGLANLKKFIFAVPEFQLNPKFTITEDGGLAYQDGAKFKWTHANVLGIALPKGWKVGETIEIPLDSVKGLKLSQDLLMADPVPDDWSPPALKEPKKPIPKKTARVAQVPREVKVEAPKAKVPIKEAQEPGVLAKGQGLPPGARRGTIQLELLTLSIRSALKAGTWTAQTTVTSARWLWHLSVNMFTTARDLLVRAFGGGIRPFVGRIWQKLQQIHSGEMRLVPKDVFAGKNPAPENVITRLYYALKQSENVQEQFEVVKTAIRKKQAAKIRALAGKGLVRERIHKKAAAMAGKMPKGGLTPLADYLTDDEVDMLLEHWEGHPVQHEMSPQQHTALGLTLKDLLLNGAVPFPNDVMWFEIAFGPRFGHLLRKRSWGWWKKAGRWATFATGVPRTFKAMWDMSATLRQGWKLFWSHPWQAGARPLGIEIGTAFPFLGEKLALRVDARFRAMEEHRVRQQSRLQTPRLSGLGQLTDFEEEFQSRFFANTPYLRHLPSLIGLRQSERMFVTFLNIQRVSVFDYHAKRIMATNTGILEKNESLKKLARFINAATGRGNYSFGDFQALANVLFFAPRYMVSQFEYPFRLIAISTRPGLKQLATRQIVAHLASYILLYMMAKQLNDRLGWGLSFDVNPISPTFLKLTIGKTTVDFSGGMTTAVRVVAQSMFRSGYDPQTDKNIKKDETIAWAFFFKNKLSPAFRTYLQIRAGKRYSGEAYAFGDPGTFSKQLAIDLVVPISAETLIEVSREHDAYGTVMLGTAEIAGLGVNIHEPREKAKPPVSRSRKRMPAINGRGR